MVSTCKSTNASTREKKRRREKLDRFFSTSFPRAAAAFFFFFVEEAIKGPRRLSFSLASLVVSSNQPLWNQRTESAEPRKEEFVIVFDRKKKSKRTIVALSVFHRDRRFFFSSSPSSSQPLPLSLSLFFFFKHNNEKTTQARSTARSLAQERSAVRPRRSPSRTRRSSPRYVTPERDGKKRERETEKKRKHLSTDDNTHLFFLL